MKRLIALLLVLMLLAGCTVQKPEPTTVPTAEPTAPPTEPTDPTGPTEPTEPTEPEEESPDMGQLKWPAAFLGIMGTGTLLMGIFLFSRRKKDDDES